MRDEVEEAMADVREVVVVSGLSRSPKAAMMTWIVIPSSAPVSTPVGDHHQPCNQNKSARDG